MYGFHGCLLHIDLSNETSSWQDLDESRLRGLSRRHRTGHEPAL